MRWIIVCLSMMSEPSLSSEKSLTPPSKWLTLQIFNTSISQYLDKIIRIKLETNPSQEATESLIDSKGLLEIGLWSYKSNLILRQNITFSSQLTKILSNRIDKPNEPKALSQLWLSNRVKENEIASFDKLIFTDWPRFADYCPPAASKTTDSVSICDPRVSNRYFNVNEETEVLQQISDQVSSHNFPRALQLAYGLQKNSPIFRPLYTVIQSTFSQFQQGNGKVAIQQP